MNGEPERLDAGGPTAAPALDAICLKAISKRPEDRYQNAREMRAALPATLAPRNRPPLFLVEAPTVRAPTPGETDPGSDVRSRETEPAPPMPATGRRGRALAAALVVLATAVAATVLVRRAAHRSTLAPSSVATPSATLPPAHEGAVPSPPSEPVASEPPLRDELTPSPSARAPVVAGNAGARSTARRPARDPLPTPAASADPTRSPPPPIAPAESAPLVAPPAPLTATLVAPAPSIAPPATVPASAPLGPSPHPESAPPSFNLATARVELGHVRSNSAAATSNSVTRTLAPLVVRFTACYRKALAESTLRASEAGANLHLESDDEGYVTMASVTGATPPGAARCIEAATRDVHFNVDTGTANVDVGLTFKPL